MADLDLDAYFARIGHLADRTPTLATLAAVLDHHMARIPFENLDVLLGRKPKLDLEPLFAKLVIERRGGYCYEHATLFAAVLEALGFTVTRHSARVTGTRPKSESTRTHMLLTVALPEGTFVVDPGYGGQVPRVPLAVDGTPSGDFWLARDGADVTLMARTGDKVAPQWVTTLERDYPVDFEMANHYTATHPASSFTRRLAMRAFTTDGRVTVSNRMLTRYRAAAAPEVTQLASGAELRAVAREYFGFDLPALDAFELPA